MRSVLFAFAVGALLSAIPASASASTITFTDSGWYDATGFHSPSNQNYSAGEGYHDFFVFNLSTVTGTVTSVTLRADNPLTPAPGYAGDATETYALFDVSTPIANLVAGGSGLVATYNDLGSGTSFGSRVFSSADNGQTVSISFNAAGIAAVQGGLGGLFAVGGALTSLGPTVGEVVFGFTGITDRQYTRELVIETSDLAAVPEPTTVSLLGLGLVGAAVARYRRRR